MKLVLLSGGSGKRLWPLSNDARSKQFLRVLENEDRERVSMVQRVWRQLAVSGLAASSFIATSRSQIEMMKSQVGPDVPLIIEPERRDTFPAVALASAYLYSLKDAPLDETVVVLPVDPFVENRFFDTVRRLDGVLSRSGADLALIGVAPTYPSGKYGYIVIRPEADTALEYRPVDHFREKPTESEAERLLEIGALWNCGVFAFRLRYMIEWLERNGWPIHYEELARQYQLLPKISFDYEVVEKSRRIVVVPYDGYWKDLGTWNTLTEEMPNRLIGKGRIADDCHNTHLINETDIPVAILGLSNVVVAASPDGILVTDKSASPRIKDFIDDNQTPMFEEREWGWVRVLDHQRYDDGRIVLTKRIGLQEGKNLGYRMYPNREEVWTIVRGEGEFVQNGNYMRVKAGNVLHIPTKTLHSVKALSDLEIIVVQSGIAAEPDHAVELYDTWADVEKHCLKI